MTNIYTNWTTKTILETIVDRKERIADLRRENLPATRWEKELVALKAELVTRK